MPVETHWPIVRLMFAFRFMMAAVPDLLFTKKFMALDLRLTRSAWWNERVKLDVIAEGFNLFNRFNEASVSPFFDDVNAFKQRASNGRYYSRPTASFDPRQFQLGLKLSF